MESTTEAVTTPPLANVPAARATVWPDVPIVLRVSSEDDVALADAISSDRLAWVEVPMALAERFARSALAVDLIMDDLNDAPSLYRISSLYGERLPRLTLPAREGIARAGAIALAVQFAVRIVPLQPSAAEVAELQAVLERYLHDTNARTPIEFFHTWLVAAVHGGRPSLWEVLERDPDLYPRIDADENFPPQEAGFVERHVAELREKGAECTRCRFFDGCGGYFKWPDPAYDCADVRGLLTSLDEAAARLRQDIQEAAQA
ncbi:MAG: hypothetical protein FJX76_04075 [Armatimonadetes bacterium]|nr:hypothetical protein [Armatimonadota bacterium]